MQHHGDTSVPYNLRSSSAKSVNLSSPTSKECSSQGTTKHYVKSSDGTSLGPEASWIPAISTKIGAGPETMNSTPGGTKMADTKLNYALNQNPTHEQNSTLPQNQNFTLASNQKSTPLEHSHQYAEHTLSGKRQGFRLEMDSDASGETVLKQPTKMTTMSTTPATIGVHTLCAEAQPSGVLSTVTRSPAVAEGPRERAVS